MSGAGDAAQAAQHRRADGGDDRGQVEGGIARLENRFLGRRLADYVLKHYNPPPAARQESQQRRSREQPEQLCPKPMRLTFAKMKQTLS